MLMTLSLLACNDGSEQIEKKVNPSQKKNITTFPERSNNTSTQAEMHTQQEKNNLLNKIQILEAQLLDANAFQPELDNALEEIIALQEQLKSTESQLKEAEEKMLSATEMAKSKPSNNDKWMELIDENIKLLDNLSELKKDLQDLDIKYQLSLQQNELLKMDVISNQQRINSKN